MGVTGMMTGEVVRVVEKESWSQGGERGGGDGVKGERGRGGVKVVKEE